MSIDLGHVLGAAQGYRELAKAALADIDTAHQRAHHGARSCAVRSHCILRKCVAQEMQGS